jgi:hypothetical protein
LDGIDVPVDIASIADPTVPGAELDPKGSEKVRQLNLTGTFTWFGEACSAPPWLSPMTCRAVAHLKGYICHNRTATLLLMPLSQLA